MLFNYGHVLELWSGTTAVRKRTIYVIWMVYDSHIITGTNVSDIFWYLSYGWGKSPEKPQLGNWSDRRIEPVPAAWEVTLLALEHSGGRCCWGILSLQMTSVIVLKINDAWWVTTLLSYILRCYVPWFKCIIVIMITVCSWF